ncbi:MAG: serine/threonine protein kinase, partial [Actinobacteria bacterium]|nr:serine/threonine protein kinase [Actinomycetota bacterium]
AVPVQNLVMAMIAKKPDERPQSSAAVSRAATALRRGDLAAAAAAVPAIAGGVVLTDAATQLLGATDTSSATRLMPATAAVPVDEEPKRKRSPWTWPLIALIVLLVLVIGGTLVALLSNQSPNNTPASSSAPSTPSSSPPVSPSASQTPTTVDVTALALGGTQCDQAIQKARDAGLTASRSSTSPAATTAAQVGTVQSTSPSGGNVPKGSAIAITCYGEQTTIPSPSSAPSIQQNGQSVAQVTAGSTVDVTWATYTCPSGTGTLSGFTVSITGATFVADGTQSRSFSPAELTTKISVAGSGTVTAKYVAVCSGTEQRSSAPSPVVQASIIPATTPNPTTTP